ncbi:BlaI/MecI/CopY family transcriptional regulator [Henriciella barbarensis]|uniref:BlaI/MecI/CopY family transcriptional regulator n=1 Tax=Henriciella barbarensis TaxID=86342 RepID=A0A399QYK7_9PROT|nr:BlaI/MecI/CopY family transcriptional regulator [Henriciella barbarensis]RIJ23611.1 BlaI/MecI/CopY family transcriptional regulator [Henriciella barbarensis]
MQIAPAELEIMNVLWDQPGIGAAEIAEVLASDKNWNIRTIKTMLGRLVEKGALETEAEGRRYLYRPLVKRGDYRRKEARQFVDRMFGGRAAPLVAHLADGKGLSADDIAELEALLGDLKK